jgi:hypothetical protein
MNFFVRVADAVGKLKCVFDFGPMMRHCKSAKSNKMNLGKKYAQHP